jgi:hypothetical protein
MIKEIRAKTPVSRVKGIDTTLGFGGRVAAFGAVGAAAVVERTRFCRCLDVCFAGPASRQRGRRGCPSA